jgi:lipoprotein-releasing system ATP-binding protein
MSSGTKKAERSGPPVLVADQLEKTYSDGEAQIRVLAGASLELRRGEVLAVTGKSGAGKSTLLHLLGLVDSPTSGRILLDGDDVAQAKGFERAEIRNQRFGFIFQAYHLVPELSALENVLLPAMMVGPLEWLKVRAGRRSHATDLLARVGLAERLRHRPAKLSGGERQRVAIARALVNGPDVLFCDEPTGNLDEATSASIHKLLKRLNEEMGLTQVIVTHDRELASQADRVVKIESGRVIGDARSTG